MDNLIERVLKPDIFDNENLNQFFNAQEALFLFTHSSRLSDKRKVEDSIIEILNKFLLFSYTDIDIEIIKSILEKNNSKLKILKNRKYNIIDKLKQINPDGFSLLGIENTIDPVILKTLYRNASKKYHPDLGGSHEKMRIINDSFFQFYDIIVNITSVNNVNDINIYDKWNDFLFSVFFTLGLIYADYYDADLSNEYLLKSENIANNNIISYNIIKYYLGNPRVGYSFIENPIKMFNHLKMTSELNYIAKLISKFIDKYVSNAQNNDFVEEKISRSLYPKYNDLINNTGTKLIINTPKQADNLYKHNIINKQKYNDVIKRIKKNNEINNERIDKINTFIVKFGFSSIKEFDKNIDLNLSKEVPAPYWEHDRYCLLSEDQKIEYEITFTTKGKGYLFEKYYQIRVNEILIALIKRNDSLDMEKLLIEIDYFSNNFNDKYDKYSLLKLFIMDLNILSNEEKEKKLQLLSDMDHLTGYANENKDNVKRKIYVDSSYINFAKQNIFNIISYNKGEFDYNSFLAIKEKIDEMENTKTAKEYNIVVTNKNPDPEIVIKTCEEYINLILKTAEYLSNEFGDNFNVSQFQIGYIINRLTIACSKLKDWEKIKYWSNIFFDLPVNYRLSSSPSELQAIKKRMEKANSM